MIGSSSEFFDYVETVVPNWSQDSRTKIGFMLMHYITLMVSVLSCRQLE
jgi:hypothetical protein